MVRKKLFVISKTFLTILALGVAMVFGLADRCHCIWKLVPNQVISSDTDALCYQNPNTGICLLIQRNSKTCVNSAGVISRNGWHIVNLSFWVIGNTAILYSANEDFASLKADPEWIVPTKFLEKAESTGYRYNVDEVVHGKKDKPLHLSFWTKQRLPED